MGNFVFQSWIDSYAGWIPKSLSDKNHGYLKSKIKQFQRTLHGVVSKENSKETFKKASKDASIEASKETLKETSKETSEDEEKFLKINKIFA